MKRAILGIAVLALVAAGVFALVRTQRTSPEAKRAQLVEGFLAVLPDSLGEDHRKEIVGLFDSLWFRYDRGLVAQADIDSITTQMVHHIGAGSISGKDLVHLMAEVGYKTYKGDPRYNLPGGEVDHPVLNPSSALITLWPDTTGYAEWQQEQSRNEKRAEEDRRDRDGTGGQ